MSKEDTPVYTLIAKELVAKDGERWKGGRLENRHSRYKTHETRQTYSQDNHSGYSLIHSPCVFVCSGAERGGGILGCTDHGGHSDEEKLLSAAQNTKKKRCLFSRTHSSFTGLFRTTQLL